MQMQLKVVLLVGLLVASVVAVVTAKTGQQMRDEKTALFTANAEAQLAPVRRLVQAKLDLSKEQLIQFTRRKESGGVAGGAFGGFDVVALQFDNGQGRWNSKWLEKRLEAPAKRFAGGREKTILASLPYSKVRDGSVQWVWRLDNKDGAMFILMVPVQIEAPLPQEAANLPEQPTQNPPAATRRGIVVGIFAGNPLAVVTEDFVSALNTVYVVDDSGYVASHSSKAYTGSNFGEDDIVKEIRASSGRTSRSGSYENLDGEKVLGRWERAEGTNLFAVIATPAKAVIGSSSGITKTMTWIGAAGTIFAMLLAFAFSRFLSAAPPTPGAGNGGITFSDEIASDDMTPIPSDSPIFEPTTQVGPPPSIAKKMNSPLTENQSHAPQPSDQAYKQMAQGLSKELRKPLAALLGHVQLLKGKTTGESAHHSASIENEARHLRDVVDALTGVAEDEKLELKAISLSEIVDIAAVNLEQELAAAKVKLKVESERVPMIDASPVHLQKAIEALCRQAIEGMRTRPGMELRMRVYDANDGRVRLQIRDSGIGIDRDQADRYFEPFYQPYEGAPNLGMSLAMAQTILARHNANPEVESIPGTGTIVTANFPVSANQAQAKFQPPPSMIPQAPPLPIPSPATDQSASIASLPPPMSSAPVPSYSAPPLDPRSIAPEPLELPSEFPRFEITEAELLHGKGMLPPSVEENAEIEAEVDLPADAKNIELETMEEPAPDISMPIEPPGLNFGSLSLGGKNPVEDHGKMPPPPPQEGMNGVAFDLKLVEATAPDLDTTSIDSEENASFPEKLPPMDLSRTAPPPEDMRELALPDMDLGGIGEDNDEFASAQSQTESTEVGTAVNFGDLSYSDSQIRPPPAGLFQTEEVSLKPPATGNEGDGFKVKIRRPKKG